MLQESLPSILTSMYGWFTPAVLFVLLNLVIGTIAVASKSSAAGNQHQAVVAQDGYGGAYSFLSRSPSLVFDRLRSFSLRRDRSGEIPPPLETPLPAAEAEEQHQHFIRSQSDAHPTAVEMPSKLAVRIKKSASKKSAFAHFEESEIADAAEAARMDALDPAESRDEVNARADDFINRFRQQLKLQRLDSIRRYKEMLCRGS